MAAAKAEEEANNKLGTIFAAQVAQNNIEQ